MDVNRVRYFGAQKWMKKHLWDKQINKLDSPWNYIYCKNINAKVITNYQFGILIV